MKSSPLTRLASAGTLIAIALLIPALGNSTQLKAADAATPATVQATLGETDLPGGFVVHVGCADGSTTHAFYRGPSFRVHGLDTDPANVTAARKRIVEAGDYGNVSIALWNGTTLPYVDNMVNLLVVESAEKLTREEMLRVLTPNGTAYVKRNGEWSHFVKPRPKNIDEWTHFLHDPTGNAVAHDDVVGPPRHLQWLGSPRWSRHHDRMASMSALVAAGGRLFSIRDEGSRVSIQLPPKWTVIARDAFNGTVLWKKPIPVWQNHLWPLKSGPTQLARRLVATDSRVFVTLGYQAPLSVLDAKTGKTIRTYENTKTTEEILHVNGVLFLLVNPKQLELAEYKPKLNVGDQGRVAREFAWNEQPRNVMAVDAETGELLWQKESKVAPLSLSADGERVYFHDGEKVVCLNGKDGKPVWSSEPASRRRNVTFNFGPRLVVYKDVVLFAGGDKVMRSLDSKTGKLLWTAPHDPSGYQSPQDLLVASGTVWSAPTTRTADSGIYTGRNPRTGDVIAKFGPKVDTYWFHHRCYLAKATDKFLLPSRTGVEFVDFDKEDWEIHHWVRGGCLYGIMPCNGLLYAPPHNCACYPEAKLYGFNALAPASKSRAIPKNIPEGVRLERGPAFGEAIEVAGQPGASDWPLYRHDLSRSGFTKTNVSAKLETAWDIKLGGRLTSPVIADGKVYVAQIDAHTITALNESSGQIDWRYTVGGRVDSPPSIVDGRVLFGSADGSVYCLRAADGELIWRYRAAPLDRRLMSFEQLESVWPVHGSVLVKKGVVTVVAGRSNFIDGGLRYMQLDVKTGRKIRETVLDEIDPETGKNLQTRIQTLQMGVALPDVLSSDGENIFMRSQQFDAEGKRGDIGPVSGNTVDQTSSQAGTGIHLFAPMGFLDDSWFHRSYWVYGKNFAGGHNGYYQAGRFAPSGRILVVDDDMVYGYGRKPQYLKWTTTLEHQLFATSKEPPIVDPKLLRRGKTAPMIRVAKSKTLDPTGKSIVVEAWVKAAGPNGVILAHGGPVDGYALVVRNGQPRFVVRRNSEMFSATANQKIVGKWAHLVGVLDKKQARIYLNGKLARTWTIPGLLTKNPQQGLEVGADDQGAVGQYRSPNGFNGLIDDVKLFHGTVNDEEIAARANNPAAEPPETAALVLSYSFNDGSATDASPKKNHGKIESARAVVGKLGKAMKFQSRGGAKTSGSFVQHKWTEDVPVYVRAMVLANKTLFIAGPPDTIDEEETFAQLRDGDESVDRKLAAQSQALAGDDGGRLWAVSATTGEKLGEIRLPHLPVWDGMAAANGSLFLTMLDGRVIRIQGK
ncbi:MAG: PQQ-binding-like beta-propeller repeat protein [Planctomycetaceae bacterium]|jgi:outer membrane protein assembly factor BamB|nr:PQQ-binding-like beta-propeller repeat protein [Planctomycetaceae bacterium]MBT6483476.1 PQQ-binding-like beta-propeller repeat protein [Planctomycetaceae bacterium]MBT6494713.1 PQQ-binding-like beta-propeller repeat protein [Planctomycetaceae bacterium]